MSESALLSVLARYWKGLGRVAFPVGLLAFSAIADADPTPLPPGAIPVLISPGPWINSPVAPEKSNYQLILEYSAPPGVNGSISLEGWTRVLPAGENQRAEFAIEESDGSPFIIRHWRDARARPDSTDRPRAEDGRETPIVSFTAPASFQIHRAFIQPLREEDHGELWNKVAAADAAIGASLYRDHCFACHGDGEHPGQYPGLRRWKDRDASRPSDPLTLWRSFNDNDDSPAAGHPRLTDEEAYHVVRYLREQLLPAGAANAPASDLPRGRVLAEPPGYQAPSNAPWRRMDHGPFLFQPLRLVDEAGKTTLEIDRSLILRLDPGIGGVTRGRVWALYDLSGFRFLGIARGGWFSDSSAIFDGNGPPGLTLRGSRLEWKEAPAVGDAPAEFKAVVVSGRDVFVHSTKNGVEFREFFLWKDREGPVHEIGPVPDAPSEMLPDPAAVAVYTGVAAAPADGFSALLSESIPAPAPADLVTGSWLRFTGLAAHEDGSLLLCTANGEVWRVDGLDGDASTPRWRRFASGLDAPHRLAFVDGVLEARCRGGWFRLLDGNNDGFCERYERKTIPTEDDVATRVEHFTRYAAPARSADHTWYFVTPADEGSPGSGLIRNDGGPPADPAAPVYVWLPGAEATPPAGPLWLPSASQWGRGLHGGPLLPCRDTGSLFRLWSPRPGDLSLPRVLWSLPIPPLETDIMATAFSRGALYLCGLPLDEETPAQRSGLWRVRRLPGTLFYPVEFAADDQSVSLRFNSPIDAAATAASRFARVSVLPTTGAPSDKATAPPARVLLGKDTLRVVSGLIAPGRVFTLECGVTDELGGKHRFVVHFTLPDELPPAILPVARPRALPPPIVADGSVPPEQDQGPSSNPLLDDIPEFELPGRLPELDDPVEEEEPLPRR